MGFRKGSDEVWHSPSLAVIAAPDQVRDDKTGVRDDKFVFRVRVRYRRDTAGSQ